MPTNMLLALATGLGAVGRLIPALGRKAELARIGDYYATASMLVMDPHFGCYDGAATPSTGSETLFDHYRSLVAGDTVNDRGDHAVF